MSDIGGVWRTVGGRRIFIKDGQNLMEAMIESGKFNNGSNQKNMVLTDDKINEMQKGSDECYQKLSDSEKEALNAYSVDAYQDINDYLLGKYDEYRHGKEITQNIDNAMLKYSLDDDIITYRLTNAQHYTNYNVGDEFVEKVYYSTSLKENIAKNVTDRHEQPIIAEIKVKKGTKCIYIGNNTAYEFEAELLLARNLSYKVLSKSEEKIVLEVKQ